MKYTAILRFSIIVLCYGNSEAAPQHFIGRAPGASPSSILMPASMGGFALAGSGMNGLVLQRYDASGRSLWRKGYANMEPSAAAPTSDGGFAVCAVANSERLAVMRVESDGNVVWLNTYGNVENVGANSIMEISGGGFLVLGAVVDPVSGKAVGWAMKLDERGNVAWSRALLSVDRSLLDGAETANGGFLVVGSTLSAGKAGAAASRMCVLKLTPKGHLAWQRVYSSLGVELKRSTRIVRTGSARFVALADSGWERPSLVGLGPDGSVLWNRVYSGHLAPTGSDVFVGTDNSVYLGGACQLADETWTDHGWIVKLNPGGTELWQKAYYQDAKAIAGLKAWGGADGGFVGALQCLYTIGGYTSIVKADSQGIVSTQCPLVKTVSALSESLEISPQTVQGVDKAIAISFEPVSPRVKTAEGLPIQRDCSSER